MSTALDIIELQREVDYWKHRESKAVERLSELSAEIKGPKEQPETEIKLPLDLTVH